MGNKIKKLMAFAITGAMFVAMFAMPVAAATNYTPVAGTSTTFKKYLVVDSDARIPSTTFNFSIAAGTAIPASSGSSMEVLAGVGTPTITADQASFSNSDTTYSTAQSGDIDIAKTGKLGSNQKYAKKNVTVNFSSVNFPEPGVYRYVITETAATAAQTAMGISNDADTDRILDVYVTDDGNGALVVSGYVMHDNATPAPKVGDDYGTEDVGAAGDALEDKNDGFTNSLESHDLTVSKDVSGNQASRDKYFALTVALSNLNAGDVYDVDLSDADATSGSNAATIAANANKTNAATITAGNDGTATATFYLQHGQSVKVTGLPKDATYTVTENAEDYKSTADGKVNSGANAVMSADRSAGFLNTRDGLIPTGILVAIGGGAVLAGAAGVGLIANRRRREDEEE